MHHAIVMWHSAISTLLIIAQSTSPLVSMGSWRPPDSAVGRPCMTTPGPCLTPVRPVPDPDTHTWADILAQPWPVPVGHQEVPGARDWGCPGPPACPAPGWGGGMGLGSQALPCHPEEPLAPWPQGAPGLVGP